MALRYRPMKREDVGSCVRLVASHPAFARQYGNSSETLRAAWRRLLGSDAFRAIVFEEIDGTAVRVLGVGVLVFVTDQFVEDAKRAPHFWLGPVLAERIVNGNSPVLPDTDVRRLNSMSGFETLFLGPWGSELRT